MDNQHYPKSFDGTAFSLRGGDDTKPLDFLQALAHTDRDVASFSLAGRPAFLVLDPLLIDSVLVAQHASFRKTEGLRRTKRLLGEGLLTAEGALHRERRAKVQPAFGRRVIESYAGMMVGHAAAAVQSWNNQSPFSLHDELARLTLRIFGEAMFGLDVVAFGGAVRAAVDEATAASNPLVSLISPSHKLRKAAASLRGIVDNLIATSRERAKADTILSLLDADGDTTGAISQQLRDDVLTLFLAGHDTLSNALTWTILLLDTHEEIKARLHREVDLALSRDVPGPDVLTRLPWARCVFMESLRLFPPAWIIAREALHAIRIGSVDVPAEGVVLVSPYITHRDERFFNDASSFRPERWLNAGGSARPRSAYIPFGFGHRACIGEGFALMEGTVVLAVATRLCNVSPTTPNSLEPSLRITMRPADSTVVATRRQAVADEWLPSKRIPDPLAI